MKKQLLLIIMMLLPMIATAFEGKVVIMQVGQGIPRLLRHILCKDRLGVFAGDFH